MCRKRVTGRFFVFLLALLAIAFLLLRPVLFPASRQSTITMANASQMRTVDCVIIRDEVVTTAESAARIEFIAPENSLVQAEQTIANVYATGYSEQLLSNLESTREKIQAYHKELLANIKDDQLSLLDNIVDAMALEFKNLINHQTVGNLQNVAMQMQTAMVNRQEYLRANKREDNKLTKLYEEENTRLSSIQSWLRVSTANRAGVVSFYIDGYETDLTPANLAGLSIADVRAVLGGVNTANYKTTSSNGIYRIVDQNNWYVAVLDTGNAWTPVVGQENYYLQVEGFDDLIFTASVAGVQKENGTTLAVFKMNDPVGPLIYKRTGKARFSINLTGLSVRVEALYNDNGQMGVWLYDVSGGTFVPVEVLSSDGKYAMIQPVVDGSLQLGQTVLIK